MADEDVQAALARQLYARLIDSGQVSHDDRVNLPDASMLAGELSDVLKNLFAAALAPRAIMIRVAGRDIGVSTPEKVYGGEGYAGRDLGLGSAQRSELPGRSTRYRAITFSCAKCAVKAYRSYYDPRCIPDCPVSGHGKLVLVR
jgi:hypothetical protein